MTKRARNLVKMAAVAGWTAAVSPLAVAGNVQDAALQGPDARPDPSAFVESAAPRPFGELPPAPAQDRDTVDVRLYQQARQAMAGADHPRAVALFRELATDHADSEYAPDAPYWIAFNLYRHQPDDVAALRSALGWLEGQARSHPNAATRRNGEASALETRIRGRLASRGDEASARAVRQAAEAPTCDEESLEMRSAALTALVRIGPDEALPVFGDLLGRRGDACAGELRMRIPYLLSQLETPEARAMLLRLARTEDDAELRGRAITHLGRTDDPAAAAYLEEVVRSGPAEFRGKAMYALVSSESPRGLELLRDVVTDPSAELDLRKRAVGYLGRSDLDVLPFLREVFGRTPELRGSIVHAVAMRNDPAAMSWLVDIALDRSADEDVRKTAIYQAGRRDDGLDDFLALWDRLESTTLRKSFIYGLSEREDPRALDLLIRTARTEADAEVRKTAIYWLGRSDDPRAAEVLKQIIGGGA